MASLAASLSCLQPNDEGNDVPEDKQLWELARDSRDQGKRLEQLENKFDKLLESVNGLVLTVGKKEALQLHNLKLDIVYKYALIAGVMFAVIKYVTSHP